MNSLSHHTLDLEPYLRRLQIEQPLQLFKEGWLESSIAPLFERARQQEETWLRLTEAVRTPFQSVVDHANLLNDRLAPLLNVRQPFERLFDWQKQWLDATNLVKIQSPLEEITESLRGFNQSLKFNGLLNSLDCLTEASAQMFEYIQPSLKTYLDWQQSTEDWTRKLGLTLENVFHREHFLNFDILGQFPGFLIETEEEDEAKREQIITEVEDHFLLTLPMALRAMDPELERLWQGAWESMFSSNPDKIRHTLTSARELVTHVLHKLSPDEELRNWSQDENYFSSGKPTREARFMFIYSGIRNSHMREYVNAEIKSHLKMINIFHVGTHGISPNFTLAELRAILRKVHSMICSLVEIRNLNE
jgi:hypothetical protein